MSTLDSYDNDEIDCYVINYNDYIKGLLNFSSEILNELKSEDVYCFIFHCSSILQIQKKVYDITSINDISSFPILYKNIIIGYRDTLNLMLEINNDNKFIVIDDKQTPPIIWEKNNKIIPVKCVSYTLRKKENIKRIKVTYTTWDTEDEYDVSECVYYYQRKKIFQINDKNIITFNQINYKFDQITYPIYLNDLITIKDNIILPEKKLNNYISIIAASIFNNMDTTNIYIESNNTFTKKI